MLGLTDLLRFLVNYGVNVDEADPSGWTALMYTIRYNGGDVRTARLLVENKADVNHREKDGWTPFLLACAYGSVDVVKLLVENGANIRVKNGMYTYKKPQSIPPRFVLIFCWRIRFRIRRLETRKTLAKRRRATIFEDIKG